MIRDRERARATVVAVAEASGRDVSVEMVDAAAADEHRRYSIYLDLLSHAPVERQRAVVTAILTDPDPAMRESVLVRVIDDLVRAVSPIEFFTWASSVDDLLRQSSLLERRIQEAVLAKQIEAGETPSSEQLLRSSDWLQRIACEVATSSSVLGVLANGGRTKRIRSSAERRLRSRS